MRDTGVTAVRHTVIRRCLEKEGGCEYACKTISKSKLRCALDVEDLRCEVAALQKLSGHPGIVGVKEVFEDLNVSFSLHIRLHRIVNHRITVNGFPTC